MDKQTDYAYIAGLLDGEGTINVSNTLLLFIRIRNTNKAVLEWVREIMGSGNIYFDRRKDKPCYSLELACKKAIEFLEPLRPYIRIKQEQVELALRLQNLYGNNKRRKRLTEAQKADRESIYWAMRHLNNPYSEFNR